MKQRKVMDQVQLYLLWSQKNTSHMDIIMALQDITVVDSCPLPFLDLSCYFIPTTKRNRSLPSWSLKTWLELTTLPHSGITRESIAMDLMEEQKHNRRQQDQFKFLKALHRFKELTWRPVQAQCSNIQSVSTAESNLHHSQGPKTIWFEHRMNHSSNIWYTNIFKSFYFDG